MEVVTDLFEGIAKAFTEYLPSLATGIYQMFINVFCTTSTVSEVTTVTGLNALGYTAVAFIGLGIVSGLLATVLGVLRLRKRKGSRRYKKARA